MNTNVSYYLDKGYQPGALFNYVSLLSVEQDPLKGRQILSLQDLINSFDLNAIKPHGVVVVPDKMDWYNKVYLKTIAETDPMALVTPLKQKIRAKWPNVNPTDDYLLKVIGIVKERITTYDSVLDEFSYFFVDPEPTHVNDSYNVYNVAYNVFKGIEPFTADNIQSAFHEFHLPKKTVREMITGAKVKIKLQFHFRLEALCFKLLNS
jgi:glutamyl/glutaminyl-tRNA synthetase